MNPPTHTLFIYTRAPLWLKCHFLKGGTPKTHSKVSYPIGLQTTPLFAVFSITLMDLEVYLCVCTYLIQVGLPQEAKRHGAFVCYYATEPVTFIRYSACVWPLTGRMNE